MASSGADWSEESFRRFNTRVNDRRAPEVRVSPCTASRPTTPPLPTTVTVAPTIVRSLKRKASVSPGNSTSSLPKRNAADQVFQQSVPRPDCLAMTTEAIRILENYQVHLEQSRIILQNHHNSIIEILRNLKSIEDHFIIASCFSD